MKTSTVDVEVTINLEKHWKGNARVAGARKSPTSPRIPRIARLMALAVKFRDMVDRGEVRDYADLARLGYVSRARITQIMNLLNLAPDLQEHLLSATPPLIISERDLRAICAEVMWTEQRSCFHRPRNPSDGNIGKAHPPTSVTRRDQQKFAAQDLR